MIQRGFTFVATALVALVALACQQDLGDSPAGPTGLAPAGASGASGGYHFTVPEEVFGVAVGNRITFNAIRQKDGSVAGRFTYLQTVQGADFFFKGSVTCFEIYDTPVLAGFPDIPAMTGNRVKWGGVIEQSTDPDPAFGPGVFIWFQSIDNGEGANAPPDLSTISGFGDEAENEAFCASSAVPNFGPHEVQGGNIQVR
jgi:hypothetical protein